MYCIYVDLLRVYYYGSVNMPSGQVKTFCADGRLFISPGKELTQVNCLRCSCSICYKKYVENPK